MLPKQPFMGAISWRSRKLMVFFRTAQAAAVVHLVSGLQCQVADLKLELGQVINVSSNEVRA